jgi:hypothetical protein
MRIRRRRFAAPFVVTVVGAAGSAGFTSCNPPRPYTAPPPEVGSPAPAPPDPGTANADPGAPGTPAVADRRWTVFKRGEECMAGIAVDCPKGEPGRPMPTCNPPPPVKYACPEGLSFDRPITVVHYTGSDACMVEPEPMSCPAGAACNPPPQPVSCPSR